MSAHNNNQQLLWGVLLGSLVTVSSIALYNNILSGKKHTSHKRRDSLDVNHLCPPGNMRGMEIVDGVDGLIGNTPLMRIRSLSEATGCTILVSISNEWCNAVALS
jgi:cysteine synthase A